MTRSLSSILSVLAIAFFTASGVNAQGTNETRTISGSVYFAETGEPARHIFVDLLSSGGSNIATGTTEDDGTFNFFGLPPASYQLSVRSPDYEPLDMPVDVTYTSSSGIILGLQKRGALASKPAGGTVSAHILSLPGKAQQAYFDGRENLYQRNRPKDAVQDFDKAVGAAPDCYEAYSEMGWAYTQIGKSGDAEKAFRKSIEVSKQTYAPAQVGLGAVLLDTQRPAEGEKVLARALELDPKSWRGYYEMGRAKLMEDKVADALTDAEKAKQLEPNAPAVYKLLANIHIKQNDGPDLLADLDSYIHLDPNSAAGQRAKELRQEVAKLLPADKTMSGGGSATRDPSAPTLNPAGAPAGQTTQVPETTPSTTPY